MQDISSWDVSRVTNMENMFLSATSFNSDISNWDVSRVVNMDYAFYLATSFNQDISSWNTSQVQNMEKMFYGAEAFNQNLCSWKDLDFPYSSCTMISSKTLDVHSRQVPPLVLIPFVNQAATGVYKTSCLHLTQR